MTLRDAPNKHMTLQECRERVDAIRELANGGDYEAAHSREDTLRADVLAQMIGATTIHQFRHAQKLAAIALETKKLHFVRI